MQQEKVSVVITKSREEIELSAAGNCLVCQFLQRQAEKADYFGEPNPIKTGMLFWFEDKTRAGTWLVHDDPYRRNEYGMVDGSGKFFELEFHRKRGENTYPPPKKTRGVPH